MIEVDERKLKSVLADIVPYCVENLLPCYEKGHDSDCRWIACEDTECVDRLIAALKEDGK